MNMQAVIPIFAVAVVAWVALIWAIVIAVTVRNVIVAVKNRGNDNASKAASISPPTTASTTPTLPTLDDSITTPTIVGMPLGTYQATHMTDTFIQ